MQKKFDQEKYTNQYKKDNYKQFLLRYRPDVVPMDQYKQTAAEAGESFTEFVFKSIELRHAMLTSPAREKGGTNLQKKESLRKLLEEALEEVKKM